jgi:hypothetical protein
VRLSAGLTATACMAAAGVLVLLGTSPRAAAGPAAGLCRMDTSRGTIPEDFAVDACFDGAALVLRNNLTLALTPAHSGDLSSPTTAKSDYGLAALATRAIGGDELLFLPGDKITFQAGIGAATLRVKGSRHAGFYALATTLATFVPGKSAGVVGAFTDLVKELNDVFEQYRTCLEGKNWVAQLGCRALFVRNVNFALGRAAVKGLAKGALSALLSAATFTKWAHAQVPEARKVLSSSAIRLAVDASRPLSRSSTCADWYAASFSRRAAFARTASPTIQLDAPVPTDARRHEAFMYGFIFGGCDRAKKHGHSPAGTALDAVLAGDYVPTR